MDDAFRMSVRHSSLNAEWVVVGVEEKVKIKNSALIIREMVWWRRVYIDLLEDLTLLPTSTLDGLQPPVIPAAGNPMTCLHQHISTHRLKHIYT